MKIMKHTFQTLIAWKDLIAFLWRERNSARHVYDEDAEDRKREQQILERQRAIRRRAVDEWRANRYTN